MIVSISTCDSFLRLSSFLNSDFQFTILDSHIFIMVLQYWPFNDLILSNFNWICDLATWGIVASRSERSILVGDWGVTCMSRS